MRIDQLCREFDLDCRYRPFPLHPETPDEGISLEQLFGGRLDIPAAMARLEQVATSLDLDFGRRDHTYNSRKAQELGIWVEQNGRFKDYENAVYRAYFVEGRNIAKTEELMRIIACLGLDVDQARQTLLTGSYSAEIDKIWDLAVSSGVRAVPTLRCEGRELVGFQSIEACRQLITG